MYVVLQSDSIHDLGWNVLVWVYPFNHKVKQPPVWLHDIPPNQAGSHRWNPALASLFLSVVCQSVVQWQMCLSIWWWKRRGEAGSRCLQLHTRLRGGVDGGGARWVCAFWEFSGRVTPGLQHGSGGGGRGRVESYDLKEPFLWSVCQRAPQQTQSQVWLVLLAELMRACALRAGALMFWVAGSLCFLSCAPSLPVPHQKNERPVEKQMFPGMYLYTLFTPPLYTLFVHSFCMSTVQQGSISPSLYPTKQTKSSYFIHIIILSIKVGNFYLSQLPLSASLSLIWAQSGCHYSGGSQCAAVHVSVARRRMKSGGGESRPRLSTNFCLTHGGNSDRKFPFASAPGRNDKRKKSCKPEIHSFIVRLLHTPVEPLALSFLKG